MKHRINYPHRPESDAQRERRIQDELQTFAPRRPPLLCSECKAGRHNEGCSSSYRCQTWRDCECEQPEPESEEPLPPDLEQRWRERNGIR